MIFLFKQRVKVENVPHFTSREREREREMETLFNEGDPQLTTQ